MAKVRQIETSPCKECGGHFLHYGNCTVGKPGAKVKEKTLFQADPFPEI